MNYKTFNSEYSEFLKASINKNNDDYIMAAIDLIDDYVDNDLIMPFDGLTLKIFARNYDGSKRIPEVDEDGIY